MNVYNANILTTEAPAGRNVYRADTKKEQKPQRGDTKLNPGLSQIQ